MKLLALLCLVAVAIADRVRYDGYKVVSVIPRSELAAKAIFALKDRFNLNFWVEPRKLGRQCHIMIPGSEHGLLIRALSALDVAAIRTINTNVQAEIDREAADIAAADAAAPFAIDSYHDGPAINAWLTGMASQHSDKASTQDFGPTYEGRMLRLIKIGTPKPGTTKPALWLDCGIHAREWISPATCVYIVNELLTKYSSNAQYKRLVDTLDLYIVPVLNPDGYAYTWSGDRMWRKTRTPYKKTSWFGQKTCYGADPNRNWDDHFGGSGDGTDPCGDTYEGPSAFSEKCTKAASDVMRTMKSLKAYFTLHSYSEMWFYPFSYARHVYPKNIDEIRAESAIAVADIAADHGQKFTSGTPADILYAAAANSMDWAVSALGVEWAFAMELRPSQGSSYGFQLPASQIIAGADEAWQGIKDVALKVCDQADN